MMRFLILGGTQLTGPHLVAALLGRGHQVTVYHRGNHAQNVPPGTAQILAPPKPGPPEDRLHLATFSNQFRALKPDVVVHMIAFTREDAQAFVRVFTGLASHAVVVSSSDVYRPMGIINRTEPGPPVPVPIDENGPLRRELSIHGTRSEKRWVEQVVLAEPKLPATVLRLPAVYGAGTYRRQDWIKRMSDGRPTIILGKGWATFRFSHGYARDVGWAIALAATSERGAWRVYNVGERNVPTERQRLEHFARVAGWNGRIVEVPDEVVPGGDGHPYHHQDWLLDTTRIRSELGFAEVSDYEEGIRATIDWQQENPNPSLKPSDFDYPAEDRFLSTLGA